MKLWKRAAGALQDQKSILVATLSRRTSYRIPELEAAIIKATSHNDKYVDYKNAQRVFAWIRTSPVSMKPLVWSLTTRMERTRNWVVTLKGLMLMHGVFCSKTPAVLRIGRLPFDLSNFSDRRSSSKMWGFNAFIRSYYGFLDQRSALLYQERKQTEDPMVQELIKLQNWQLLLDILLQIKPLADNNMRVSLILEAMDCLIVEIFDVYSRICNGIAKLLVRIYSAGKLEASLALKVLKKAITQGEDLTLYFEFCKDFGVFNAMEVPKVIPIPEEDIRDLERIINGVSCDDDIHDKDVIFREEDVDVECEGKKDGRLKTIITHKWEVFEEDLKSNNCCKLYRDENPFESSQNYVPLIPDHVPVYKQEIPDFISF